MTEIDKVSERGDEIVLRIYHFVRDHYEFFLGFFIGLILAVIL